MGHDARTEVAVTYRGEFYKKVVTPSPVGVTGFRGTVQPAKTGTLSTRTSTTVGTLTMAGGHGITTGVLIDLFWSGGSRARVTVGSVSGNSVPISGG